MLIGSKFPHDSYAHDNFRKNQTVFFVSSARRLEKQKQMRMPFFMFRRDRTAQTNDPYRRRCRLYHHHLVDDGVSDGHRRLYLFCGCRASFSESPPRNLVVVVFQSQKGPLCSYERKICRCPDVIDCASSVPRIPAEHFHNGILSRRSQETQHESRPHPSSSFGHGMHMHFVLFQNGI